MREAAATKFDLLSEIYRLKTLKAYGAVAFTSYNCAESHFGDTQRECESDFADYSTEGQEHVGKIFKQEIKLTNGKLHQATNRTKQGQRESGFVQQALTRVIVRQHVKQTSPQRPTKRHREIEHDGRKPRLDYKAGSPSRGGQEGENW